MMRARGREISSGTKRTTNGTKTRRTREGAGPTSAATRRVIAAATRRAPRSLIVLWTGREWVVPGLLPAARGVELASVVLAPSGRTSTGEEIFFLSLVLLSVYPSLSLSISLFPSLPLFLSPSSFYSTLSPSIHQSPPPSLPPSLSLSPSLPLSLPLPPSLCQIFPVCQGWY